MPTDPSTLSPSGQPLVTVGSGGLWRRCGTLNPLSCNRRAQNPGMKVVLPQINFIQGSALDECRIHRCPGGITTVRGVRYIARRHSDHDVLLCPRRRCELCEPRSRLGRRVRSATAIESRIVQPPLFPMACRVDVYGRFVQAELSMPVRGVGREVDRFALARNAVQR
jgi:hypothetical protein